MHVCVHSRETHAGCGKLKHILKHNRIFYLCTYTTKQKKQHIKQLSPGISLISVSFSLDESLGPQPALQRQIRLGDLNHK